MSAEPDLILEGNLLDPLEGPGRTRLELSGGRIYRMTEIASGVLDSGGAPTREPSASGPGLSGLPGSDRAVPASLTERDSAPNTAPRLWTLPADLWILPGFVDGHTHLLALGLAPLRPDLEGSRSRREALERLEAWLSAHPGSGPVIGEGWDQSLWPDPAPPTREDLDRIAPARPVAMRRVCGHIAVLNSRALELLGVEWPDLDTASGFARELLPLSLHQLWPPSEAQLDEAVALAQRRAWSQGVTGIQEMGHADGFRAFGRAAVRGTLALRVTHFLGVDALDAVAATGLTAGLGDERLRFGGIKIFLDGSIGGRSTAVRQPYADGGSGMLLRSDAELEDILARAARAGLPVAMHAIGDAAIVQAIGAVERLRRAGVPPAGPGPRIEHAEMLDGALLERAVNAGFYLSMQPNFTARWQNPGEMYETALGPERARALNPYRRVGLTGRLLFGSDVMPLGPLFGLRGAMGHPSVDERMDVTEAIRAYTAGSANAVARPFGDGALRPGSPADLVLLRIPGGRPETADFLSDRVSVVATWVDGRLRYDAPGAPVPAWLDAAADAG